MSDALVLIQDGAKQLCVPKTWTDEQIAEVAKTAEPFSKGFKPERETCKLKCMTHIHVKLEI